MILDALDALDLASMHSRIFLEAWSSSLFRSAKFTWPESEPAVSRILDRTMGEFKTPKV